MPRVKTSSGTKKYPYTEKGKSMAKKAAMRPAPKSKASPLSGHLKGKMPRI